MDAYYGDVVVVIELGAYIHGVQWVLIILILRYIEDMYCCSKYSVCLLAIVRKMATQKNIFIRLFALAVFRL